jgi:hypothetical protein
MGVIMKKLSVLFVTMLTAILAFSFSAFAYDTVHADNTLRLERNGSGSQTVYVSFNKDCYDPTIGMQDTIKENFKTNILSTYTDLVVDETEQYTIFKFNLNFNNLKEYNSIAFDLNQNSIAADTFDYTEIVTTTNKVTFKVSKIAFNALSTAVDCFLFEENPIANYDYTTTKHIWFTDSLGAYDVDFNKEGDANFVYYDFNLNTDQATPAPTKAPANANNAKTTVTSKATNAPKTAAKDKTPKTGDSSRIILLISLMGVSLVLGAVSIKKMKQR